MKGVASSLQMSVIPLVMHPTHHSLWFSTSN